MMLMLLFPLLLQLGSTAIGLKTKDGVVLAVEKRVTSPLLVLTELTFPSS
jgi:20S proteasome alpha/beta subunit